MITLGRKVEEELREEGRMTKCVRKVYEGLREERTNDELCKKSI